MNITANDTALFLSQRHGEALAPQNRSFLKKFRVAQLVKYFLAFMKSEDSLPYSEKSYISY
jgi:hypothetical protein